jgi:hypothetical protein
MSGQHIGVATHARGHVGSRDALLSTRGATRMAYALSMPDQTTPGPQGDGPKLIIDSDWKNQAQAEKDRLAAKQAAAKQAGAKASGVPTGAGLTTPASGVAVSPASAAGQGESDELPPADFQALLGTMVTQALMYMGAFPDPETGRAIVSPDHARLHIDLLAVLQEKTKGNLTPEESEALSQVLGELRMRFVELNQAVAQMMAERAAKGRAAGIAKGPSTGPKLTF